MLRIATSVGWFSFLALERLRGELLNLNLFDPIGICACPRIRNGPPLQCRAVFMLSLATVAPYATTTSNALSSARLRVSAVRYWGDGGGGPVQGGGPLSSLHHSLSPN